MTNPQLCKKYTRRLFTYALMITAYALLITGGFTWAYAQANEAISPQCVLITMADTHSIHQCGQTRVAVSVETGHTRVLHTSAISATDAISRDY